MREYHVVWWPATSEWALLKERACADRLYIARSQDVGELLRKARGAAVIHGAA